jgi:hypothetical protein
VLALLAVGMNTMRGPLLTPDDDFLPALAYTLTCIAAIVMGVALGVRKPKVPERRPGESVEAYWKRPEIGVAAFGVWFLMEAAAMLTTIGYALTGHPVILLAMGMAIATFWMIGPNVFAKP